MNTKKRPPNYLALFRESQKNKDKAEVDLWTEEVREKIAKNPKLAKKAAKILLNLMNRGKSGPKSG